MRRNRHAALAAFLILSSASSADAQTPALIWAKSFSGAGLQSASNLALRGSNLWISGGNNGTIDLGGATHPESVYLALFGTDGSYQWSRGIEFSAGGITAMGADSGNNIYVTGQFSGTVDLGAGPLTSTAGTYDIFLAKYNSTGVHQWSKKFGDAGINDAGLALVIDNANNVIIGGRFSGTTEFGGGPLTTAGGMDAFIAKFNSAGTHVWSKKFGDASDQYVNAIASFNGDVYATGTFAGGINLGGSTFNSAGQNDIFLARFNSAGAHQWSKSFGGASFDYGVDVDTDGAFVYLLAQFQATVNFGGTSITSAGGQDIAVAKFTLPGVHAWSKGFGDADTQSGAAIDVAGGVYVAGWFQGAINFGHALTTGATSDDAFIARLSPTDGSEVWSQQFGTPYDSDFASDLVSDGAHTFIGGHYYADIDLGHNGELFAPNREWDGYVAEFGNLSQEPHIVSVEDVDDDQGGKVTVRITRSEYDALTTVLPVRGYEVYLRDDPLNLRTAGGTGADRTAADTWILAGEVPAHGLSEYYTFAFTQQDSTIATGMHSSVYKVRAITDDPAVYLDSPVLGGYSLDNLVPGVPLNFVLTDGQLTWRAGVERDIAYYSVYGSTSWFDAAQLIGSTAATSLDVTSRPFAHYYVTATDRAGNESRPAALDGSPSGSATAPRTLSVSAFPNPFNPATTIRYTLPASGRVRVDVFDAGGTHVRRLVNHDGPAGAFAVRWDGHDDTGARVASGIYFARIEHNGAARAYKMVVLK